MYREDVDTKSDGVFPAGATRNGLPIKIVRANAFKGFRIESDKNITELGGLFTSMKAAQEAVGRYIEESRGRNQEAEDARKEQALERKRGKLYSGGNSAKKEKGGSEGKAVQEANP